MIDERKVEKAIAFGLCEIRPSSDLLDRINRESAKLATASGKPSLWERLRLGERLELAATCILIVGLIGLVVYSNINLGQAPAGGDPGGGKQGMVGEQGDNGALNPGQRFSEGDVVQVLREAGFEAFLSSDIPESVSVFGVKGYAIKIGDETLVVYVFADETAQERVSISADGYSIGIAGRSSELEWVAPPHFVRVANIIVTLATHNERLVEQVRLAVDGLTSPAQVTVQPNYSVGSRIDIPQPEEVCLKPDNDTGIIVDFRKTVGHGTWRVGPGWDVALRAQPMSINLQFPNQVDPSSVQIKVEPSSWQLAEWEYGQDSETNYIVRLLPDGQDANGSLGWVSVTVQAAQTANGAPFEGVPFSVRFFAYDQNLDRSYPYLQDCHGSLAVHFEP